ncbi:MAG: T9SS type A sorting domain-containing protein [Bacteroidales bacterium]|nr:T9SS type A sorting domain-containing protein [Bacteroidales bacterium]
MRQAPEQKALVVSESINPGIPIKPNAGRADEIIRYDDGVFASGIGVFNGATLYAASYFPADSMSQYAGMYLDMVEMYINDLPIEAKVIIYGMGTSTSPGDILIEQEFVPVENAWNLIDLTYPILLDGDDLWIAYSAVHNGGQAPCGADVGPAVIGLGDWYSVDGGPWSILGLDRNWNLAGHLTYEPIVEWLHASPLSGTLGQDETTTIELSFDSQYLEEGVHEAQLIFTSNDPSNPQVIIPVVLDVGGGSLNPPENLSAEVTNSDVTLTWDAPNNTMLMGYNIYRDEVKINPAPVTQTTYFDPGVAPGTHLYSATALYSYGESAKSDPVQVFIEGDVGKIHGFVRDAVTNLAIEKAIITATNTENGVITFNTPFGAYYSLLLPAGYYDVTCKSDGYESFTLANVSVIENMNKAYTFYLQPLTDLLTGLDDEHNYPVSIYPNPARDQIFVTGEDLLKIEIVSQTGKVMLGFEGLSGKQTVDISRLPVGIYIIRVTTKNSVITEKLIIR